MKKNPSEHIQKNIKNKPTHKFSVTPTSFIFSIIQKKRVGPSKNLRNLMEASRPTLAG